MTCAFRLSCLSSSGRGRGIPGPKGLQRQKAELQQCSNHCCTCIWAWPALPLALSQAFGDLRLRAGGTESGRSWKADLANGTSWDALCTLANQTVLKERPFYKVLDKYFVSFQKSFAELQEALSWPDLPTEAQEARDLLAQGPATLQLARVTGSEIYFLETILLVRPDKQRSRLKKRKESLKEFNVPAKQVHKLIWQKVNEILGEE